MNFEIGTYAWAVTKNKKIIANLILVPGSIQRKFLIIGRYNHDILIILVDSSYISDGRITTDLVTQLEIDPQYLGMEHVKIHVDNLEYCGRKCAKCHSRFDHLESDYHFFC